MVFVLLQEWRWAYPPSLIILTVFAYRLYRYAHTGGLDLALTVLDLIVIGLV